MLAGTGNASAGSTADFAYFTSLDNPGHFCVHSPVEALDILVDLSTEAASAEDASAENKAGFTDSNSLEYPEESVSPVEAFDILAILSGEGTQTGFDGHISSKKSVVSKLSNHLEGF